MLDWLLLIPISIVLGFGLLWADQLKWISDGMALKERRKYTWVIWGIYSIILFTGISLGVVLNV